MKMYEYRDCDECACKPICRSKYPKLGNLVGAVNCNNFVPKVKQEWISVKDKKPEVGVRVMVCGKRGGINIGRLDYPEDEYICAEKGHCYRGYTHWMPLPEPPKEL